MKFRELGDSGISVSEICLGTMTWGEQNTEAEAHAQLDYAVAHGVNFIDAAEMYPVPANKDTQGRTETILGNWLKRQKRDKLVIASKVAGPSRNITWIREGRLSLDRDSIVRAVDDSLRRLQTDYLDLYQIHWPERNVPLFGQTAYDPALERDGVEIAEQLETFGELVDAGKIRALGLSNETPWGVMEFARLAELLDLPRAVSIQNAYNLMNRAYEQGLSEITYRENIGLLAYSPLAFGVLSGKYEGGATVEQGRLTRFPQFGPRYRKPNCAEAVSAYLDLAKSRGVAPVLMSLGFVRTRFFVTSTIIGATTLEQLGQNISAADFTPDESLLKEIDAIHARYPNPAY